MPLEGAEFLSRRGVPQAGGLIAELEGPSFISRTVERRLYSRRRDRDTRPRADKHGSVGHSRMMSHGIGIRDDCSMRSISTMSFQESICCVE